MKTEISAEDFFLRIKQKYKQCQSYKDCGFVQFMNSKNEQIKLEFKTHFNQPADLNFEWQDYGPARGVSKEYSVFRSFGSNILVKFFSGVKEYEDISLACAAVSGCSAGAAQVIFGMLVEKIRLDSKHFFQMNDVKFVDADLAIDADEYSIVGSLDQPDDHRIWVSKKDMALSRLKIRKTAFKEDISNYFEDPFMKLDSIPTLEMMYVFTSVRFD